MADHNESKNGTGNQTIAVGNDTETNENEVRSEKEREESNDVEKNTIKADLRKSDQFRTKAESVSSPGPPPQSPASSLELSTQINPPAKQIMGSLEISRSIQTAEDIRRARKSMLSTDGESSAILNSPKSKENKEVAKAGESSSLLLDASPRGDLLSRKNPDLDHPSKNSDNIHNSRSVDGPEAVKHNMASTPQTRSHDEQVFHNEISAGGGNSRAPRVYEGMITQTNLSSPVNHSIPYGTHEHDSPPQIVTVMPTSVLNPSSSGAVLPVAWAHLPPPEHDDDDDESFLNCFCCVIANVRWNRFILAFFVLLTTAIITSAVLARRPQKKQLTTTPRPEDTFSELKMSLSLQSWDGGVALSTRGSPQEAAFLWLISDSRINAMTETQIFQRYALGSLFYAFHGKDWLNQSGWMSLVNNECEWFGIECFDSQLVVKILLPRNGLKGTIASEILMMKETLNEIDLDFNSIAGSVPDFFGNLAFLERLAMDSNQLTGTIPSVLGNLDFMRFLNFERNMLTGSIPSELMKMKEILWIELDDNNLVGSIPTEIDQQSTLVKLNIDNNLLTGPIPSSLWDASFLRFFRLAMNDFTGTLSSKIGNLGRYKTGNVDLSLNDTRLRGPVPQSIADIATLRVFDIHNTDMTGSIPSNICDLFNVNLKRLIADCAGPMPKVNCSCCTQCF